MDWDSSDPENSVPVQPPKKKKQKRKPSPLEKLINTFGGKEYTSQLIRHARFDECIKKNKAEIKNAKELEMFEQYQQLIDQGIDPMNGKISIINHKVIGRYCVALQPIEEGAIVGEYVGDLLPEESLKGKGIYRFCIRELPAEYGNWYIDAETRCNHTAFFAHNYESSEDPFAKPNLEFRTVIDDQGHFHIVFFALKKIQAGQVLSYDYEDDGYFESLLHKPLQPVGLPFNVGGAELKAVEAAVLQGVLYEKNNQPTYKRIPTRPKRNPHRRD